MPFWLVVVCPVSSTVSPTAMVCPLMVVPGAVRDMLVVTTTVAGGALKSSPACTAAIALLNCAYSTACPLAVAVARFEKFCELMFTAPVGAVIDDHWMPCTVAVKFEMVLASWVPVWLARASRSMAVVPVQYFTVGTVVFTHTRPASPLPRPAGSDDTGSMAACSSARPMRSIEVANRRGMDQTPNSDKVRPKRARQTRLR